MSAISPTAGASYAVATNYDASIEANPEYHRRLPLYLFGGILPPSSSFS
jgi:hypothetical protein